MGGQAGAERVWATQPSIADVAATLLRGLIDAGDYMGDIFPLVFLKRISDVWDEEHAAALDVYGGDAELADLPENHRFTIPDGAHWEDIRQITTNIGRRST